jgi:hypothetical protein
VKIIWLNHPEDVTAFLKLYEWSFKILGWLTALAALKFAYVKTNHTLFFIIYIILLCLWTFPLGTSLFFQLDIPWFNSALLKRVLGRLPAMAIILSITLVLNWVLSYTVDEIVDIQLTANCKPSG